MPSATWVKGKRKIKGWWEHVRSKDLFIIHIFKRCTITGERINIEVHGDEPEFNGWKLEKPVTNKTLIQNVSDLDRLIEKDTIDSLVQS